MVYCEGVEVESKLGKLIQAFRCDRPDEWTMDEFIRMAEDMHKEITILREAERDAARYRWLRDVAQHKYYVDDILACTLRGADGCIDEYMKERGDE